METNAQEKAWIAKIAGSCYFILLGFGYAVMELVSGRFDLADFGVLVWSCLPILINKRWMYLCFGGMNLVIWSYLAIVLTGSHFGGIFSLLITSTIVLGAIASALLLIYAALTITDKRFNLI